MPVHEKTQQNNYIRPHSVAAAISALQTTENGVLVAGGVVVGSLINQGLLTHGTIIDISRIENLRRIEKNHDGSLSLGALVSHDDILKSPVVAAAAPLLAEIAKDISCGRLRNRGTIGGSLCMIGQQGDPATGLIALGAELQLRGPAGQRVIKLEDFYRDAFEIDLQPGELVEAVSVPAAIGQERWGFAKLGPRNAMDWTQIAVSVVLSLDRSSGSIEQVRIGMNGVAPSALRARHAETALSGRTVTALDWPRITAALDRDIAPQGDVVFSERYKRHLASVLLKRAILKSFKVEADGKRDIQ